MQSLQILKLLNASIVRMCKAYKSITSRPAMSPDMNPIEHVWDFIGRKINKRNPKCQKLLSIYLFTSILLKQ
jgi:transposase